MDGILIIDKPEGITSHDVVARVRRILKTKKVGHTGTLDPFATGVMTVLVGRATRLAQFIDKDEKRYVAVMRFGFDTDTGDLTGERLTDAGDTSPRNAVLKDIEMLKPQFIGQIEQIPPMYSAKKIDGKKLYELAREGKSVERKPASVFISGIEIVGHTNLTVNGKQVLDTLTIDVTCGAGTYIRTLAVDMAHRAGSAAHLTELRRTRSGRFGIDESITLEALAELDDRSAVLRDMSEAVAHLDLFELRDDRVARTLNGMSTRVYGFESELYDGQQFRMTAPDGRLIAVGIYRKSENSIFPTVVLG